MRKSTLLKTLAGFIPPVWRAISLAGKRPVIRLAGAARAGGAISTDRAGRGEYGLLTRISALVFVATRGCVLPKPLSAWGWSRWRYQLLMNCPAASFQQPLFARTRAAGSAGDAR